MYFTGFLLVDGTDHPSDAGARRFSTGASNVARRRSWYRYRAMAAVNLRSDTQTRPSDGMRRAIASAEVAGEQRALDPTGNARLMNAVVASGVPAADFAWGFDTAWLDFTKGLGAPVGACLVGSRELIAEAWRFKQMMGGALRQAGIVAAAGLYALDHNVERLA